MQDAVAKKPQRMVRKQILITPEQNRRLKKCATAAGIPEADIVRQGVELALETRESQSRDWREKLEQFLQGEPLDAVFEERMRGNKRGQREAWRKRLQSNRRSLAGD